jgi:hypothetical protein
MTTFLPAVNFTGFPDGNHRNPVRFKVGVESVPVPEAFAQLVREKGLVATDADAKFLRASAQVPREPTRIDPPKAAVSRKIAAATKSRRTGKAVGRSSKT